MTSRSSLDLNTSINVSTQTIGETIHQFVDLPGLPSIQERIIRTQDDHVKKALIDLGWVCPQEAKAMEMRYSRLGNENLQLRADLAARDAEIAVDAGRLRDAAMRVWGEDAHGCDTHDRLADAILGLRAQIADLKRGGVVVPERSIDDDEAILKSLPAGYEFDDGPIPLIHAAVAWVRERSRTIPADRVLGEVIRRIAETKLEEDDDEYEMSWDASYSKLSEIVNDCRYALRAQPTQERTMTRADPRPIPADRELMRLVDELIRWHGLRPLDKRPDHAAALVGAIKALRAQPTQELAP